MSAGQGSSEVSGLHGNRQRVRLVDHHFALRTPAWLSGPDQHSLVTVHSPILAWRLVTATAGTAVFRLRLQTEHPSSPLQELSLYGWPP